MSNPTTRPTAAMIVDSLGKAPQPLSNVELQVLTGKTQTTVSAALRALIADGTVVKVVVGKVGRYTLAPVHADVNAEGIDADTAPVRAALSKSDVDTALAVIEKELVDNADAIAAIMDAPVSAATPAGTNSWDADRPGVRAEDDVPTPAPAADACKCGDDTVGHVHPAPRKAVRAAVDAAKKGKIDRARAAALAALTAAGADGMPVPAVWAVMQEAGPLAEVGAYHAVNALTKEGAVIVTAERAVRERTARIAG